MSAESDRIESVFLTQFRNPTDLRAGVLGLATVLPGVLTEAGVAPTEQYGPEDAKYWLIASVAGRVSVGHESPRALSRKDLFVAVGAEHDGPEGQLVVRVTTEDTSPVEHIVNDRMLTRNDSMRKTDAPLGHAATLFDSSALALRLSVFGAENRIGDPMIEEIIGIAADMHPHADDILSRYD